MFFAWGRDSAVIVGRWFPILSCIPENFTLVPLFSCFRKEESKESLQQLENEYASGNYAKIELYPVYLRSSDSSLRNILKPTVFFHDFSVILQTILRCKPDAIVCFYVDHAYPLAFFKSFRHYKLIPYAMGSDVNSSSNFLEKLLKKFVYSRSDAIFSVAFDLKQKIQRLTQSKVIVIPHGIDIQFFKPLNSKNNLRKKWHIPEHDFVLLTVCRLDANKGVDLLIKALKILNSSKTEKSTFRMLICGDGPARRELEELSSALGIEERVLFLGFTNKTALLELYNTADVFALASYSEGLPKVLLEAMACGCIPVMTKVGDVGKVLIEGFNGYTFNPGDAVTFVKQIKEISSFPIERVTIMQQSARETVKSNFDNQELVYQMVQKIEELKRFK